ncbi:hypothetical protein [Streptomyces sp. NPDC006668]|uniref:hypothetical protein n=1 Tax=Streptomyces sp. NPDC006668 TaxID=3156903 RepID=UPI0033F09A49
MAKLACTVFLRDPEQGPIRLEAGEEVPERLVQLIPNPAAWSGEAPSAEESTPNPIGAGGEAEDAPSMAGSASVPEPEPSKIPRRRAAKAADASE